MCPPSVKEGAVTKKRRCRDPGPDRPGSTDKPARMWVLTRTHGYPADGFHGSMPMEHTLIGLFSQDRKEQAIKISQDVIGSTYGLSWDELEEENSIEMLHDTSDLWEALYASDDSEMSQVRLALVETNIDLAAQAAQAQKEKDSSNKTHGVSTSW